MNDIYEVKDWVKGNPEKSGSYIVKSKEGTIGRDFYCSVGCVWWSEEVQYYSPASYRELGYK